MPKFILLPELFTEKYLLLIYEFGSVLEIRASIISERKTRFYVLPIFIVKMAYQRQVLSTNGFQKFLSQKFCSQFEIVYS